MNRKSWVLLGLALVALGCAPLTSEEAQEQEEGLSHTVLSPGRESVVAPSGVISGGLPSSVLETNPDISVTLACSCHLEVYENGGLVCVRMKCSEGCSQRTQECSTLFGGCGTR